MSNILTLPVDFQFIGMGSSSSVLILKMNENNSLRDKIIAIIDQGKIILYKSFKHVSINHVITFLSKKSSLSKELFMFSKLPILIYLRVAFKCIFYRFANLPPTYLAFTLTMASLLSYWLSLEVIPWLLLGIGFLSVGLSHGVLDYLTDKSIQSRTQFLTFILGYLLKGALLGLLWLGLPDIALFVFIAFSAWHFGEADYREWNLKQGFSSFVWGLIVLITILSYHYDETIAVLQHIKGLHINHLSEGLSVNHLLIGKLSVSIFSILFSSYHRSRFMFLTLFYLILSTMLPLIVSFGIYFVAQHSLHGWRHLKTDLKTNSYHLWLKSLPFSSGGAFIILIFMLVNNKDYIGVFFIILSCFSMPHVISMYNFYASSNKKYGLN